MGMVGPILGQGLSISDKAWQFGPHTSSAQHVGVTFTDKTLVLNKTQASLTELHFQTLQHVKLQLMAFRTFLSGCKSTCKQVGGESFHRLCRQFIQQFMWQPLQ
jgi:hypothetical protein